MDEKKKEFLQHFKERTLRSLSSTVNVPIITLYRILKKKGLCLKNFPNILEVISNTEILKMIIEKILSTRRGKFPQNEKSLFEFLEQDNAKLHLTSNVVLQEELVKES